MEIWKSPSEGGDAIPMTTAGGRAAYESWDGEWLYFVREDELWRMPPSGGREASIHEGVRAHYWAPAGTGFYYVPVEKPNEILHVDLDSGAAQLVAEFPTDVRRPWANPNGRWLTVQVPEENESDLALVEDFE